MSNATEILANYRPDNVRKNNHFKKDHNNKRDQPKGEEKRETSFAQTKKEAICYCCGKKGHYATECHERNKKKPDEWAIKKGLQHLQNEIDKSKDEDKDTKDDPRISKEIPRVPPATTQRKWAGVDYN